MKSWRAVRVTITYRTSHRPSISVQQLSRSSDPQTNRQTDKRILAAFISRTVTYSKVTHQSSKQVSQRGGHLI